MPVDSANRDKPIKHVTFRRVSVERLEDHNAPLVFCPRRSSVISAAECRNCDHFAGLCINPSEGDAFLRCTWDAEHPRSAQDLSSSADLSLGAGRTPISELMSTPVECVTANAPLEKLAALFLAKRVSALPVVGREGEPIGIVTKTDVLERYYDAAEDQILDEAVALVDDSSQPETAAERQVTAADLMTRAVFSIGAHESISMASALMAYEGVHHVLVLAADGAPVGIVSALDIVGWVARSDGYVVPRPKRSTPPQ